MNPNPRQRIYDQFLPHTVMGEQIETRRKAEAASGVNPWTQKWWPVWRAWNSSKKAARFTPESGRRAGQAKTIRKKAAARTNSALTRGKPRPKRRGKPVACHWVTLPSKATGTLSSTAGSSIPTVHGGRRSAEQVAAERKAAEQEVLRQMRAQALQIRIEQVKAWAMRGWSGTQLPRISVPDEGGICDGCGARMPGGRIRLTHAVERCWSRPRCTTWALGG